MLHALIIFLLSMMPCEATPTRTIRVFVSMSLPDQTLQTLFQDVEKSGGTLVIRGLIENSFLKTAKKFQLLKISAQIDPQAFQKEDIRVVPTFLLEEENRQDKVSGHVSLRYVLELFTREGERTQEAKRLLKSLGERS